MDRFMEGSRCVIRDEGAATHSRLMTTSSLHVNWFWCYSVQVFSRAGIWMLWGKMFDDQQCTLEWCAHCGLKPPIRTKRAWLLSKWTVFLPDTARQQSTWHFKKAVYKRCSIFFLQSWSCPIKLNLYRHLRGATVEIICQSTLVYEAKCTGKPGDYVQKWYAFF